jgi:hypothetical protein
VKAQQMLYDAVKYALDRSQEDPNFGYYCGPGTQAFYLLVKAEAEHTGRPLDEVEAERSRDRQPQHRRRLVEVVKLREHREALRRLCEENGLDWSAPEDAAERRLLEEVAE